MMDKELILKNAYNKFKNSLLEIVLEQISDYEKLLNSDYQVIHNYRIGDEVIINENHLLHGIGNHIDLLEPIFSKRGVVSQDFYGANSNHAFCYTAAFWKVNSSIKLEDYIKNYSGIVAKYNDIYEVVPYGQLDNFVEKMKKINHWLWIAESSMEIRFMPSLAKNENQIGFIVNCEHEVCKKMRENSVFNNLFNQEYSSEFVNDKAKEKFSQTGFVDDFFSRAEYLIFGLPKNCIEGIIVGRIIEHNDGYLNKLKELFPHCYISNLDGRVIA